EAVPEVALGALRARRPAGGALGRADRRRRLTAPARLRGPARDVQAAHDLPARGSLRQGDRAPGEEGLSCLLRACRDPSRRPTGTALSATLSRGASRRDSKPLGSDSAAFGGNYSPNRRPTKSSRPKNAAEGRPDRRGAPRYVAGRSRRRIECFAAAHAAERIRSAAAAELVAL